MTTPAETPRARLERLAEDERPALAAAIIREADTAALGRFDTENLQWLAFYATRLPERRDGLYLVDRIYALQPLSATFLEREAERMKALAGWMIAELDTDGLRKRWPEMPEADRLAVLDRAIRRHDEIAGIAPHARIELMHMRRKGGITRRGDYDPNTALIRLNAGLDGIFQNLTETLSVLIHENTHHQQHARIQALSAGTMAEDHPDIADTRWFKLPMVLGGDTRPLGHAAYRRMPHEIHARANADALTRALNPLMRLARRLGIGAPRPVAPVFGARP